MANQQCHWSLSTFSIRILIFFSLSPILIFSGCSNATDHQGEKLKQNAQDPLVVPTVYGSVSGLDTESMNVKAFRGIPYAKPPVGDLRWRPPEPPNSWQRTKLANKFGLPCWQSHSENAFVWSRGIFERSEDCLYLNVWTDSSSSSPKPVMVWFHGGSHTGGWGHGEVFDGTRLAELGVVIVTINYRLGPWGFLAHPLLTEESDQNSSGNYGLLDKIASLKWVKDNIENFGGDPQNVTIFGQSAGSMSVCTLMASPLSKGLFHKAIGQSAACLNPFDTDAKGFERGIDLIEQTKANTLKDLRALSNQQLINATTSSSKWRNQSKITIDGWVLPEPPLQTFLNGKQAEVPLLVGSMANEGHLLFPIDKSLTDNQLENYLNREYGKQFSREFKHLYKTDLNKSPGLAKREINTDHFMAYSMRLWAQFNYEKRQPTFLYFMQHIPPAFQIYLAEEPDLDLPEGPRSAGAYHSGDLAFVFNNVGKIGLDWQKRDYDLASAISRYWTNFAKSGDPNGSQLTNWPTYDTTNHNTLVFDTPIVTVQGVRKEKLDLIARATAEN